MKYFLVEGILTHPEKMTKQLMEEHQSYTGSMMKEGTVLFSSLKCDMSASVTVIKAETEEMVQKFYGREPFFKNGILTYRISELEVHYHIPDGESWF